MPLPHLVILNYDATNVSAPFGPTPRQVAVKPNDTIHFQIGPGTLAANPGCRLRITLHDDRQLSARSVEHAPGQNNAAPLLLTVRPGLAAILAALRAQPNPVITGYKCEILTAAGDPIPGLSADGSSGGEIVPDSSVGA